MSTFDYISHILQLYVPAAIAALRVFHRGSGRRPVGGGGVRQARRHVAVSTSALWEPLWGPRRALGVTGTPNSHLRALRAALGAVEQTLTANFDKSARLALQDKANVSKSGHLENWEP